MSEKKLQWLMGLFMLVLVAALMNETVLEYVWTVNADTKQKEKTIVVLDAGHGGIDPGKIGINEAKEKDINLQITGYLKEYLEADGVEIVLTRESDEGLYSEYSTNKKREDMQKRCAIIRETQPIVAVSIHQNSYHKGGESGCQVFYFSKSTEGKRLAQAIQEQMLDALQPATRREIKENDSYYMLRHTVVPTVIVECGFLSNWNEAQLLVTEEYQRKVARAVADGVLKYLKL